MSTLPMPGDQIGRYTVLYEVARGGMAAVYAARTSGVGGFEKVVALKTILPELSEERRFVEMLLDEARIAAHVNHPNVVAVYDVQEHEGLPILTMELVHGRSFAHVAAAEPAASVGVKLRLLSGAARGVHAAHETCDEGGTSLGIVHRDVSPQNILVSMKGHVKVTDFGVAVGRGRNTRTRSGEIKGKIRYLAPEQITRERPTDRRADVWALGVVAWELLAGRKLFEGEDDAQRMFTVLSQAIPDLRTLVPGIPDEVALIVQESLSRDPDRRLASAELLATVFDRHAANANDVEAFMRRFEPEVGEEQRRLHTAMSQVPTRVMRPRRWPFALVAAALLVVGLGGGFVALVDPAMLTGAIQETAMGPSAVSATGIESEPTLIASSPNTEPALANAIVAPSLGVSPDLGASEPAVAADPEADGDPLPDEIEEAAVEPAPRANRRSRRARRARRAARANVEAEPATPTAVVAPVAPRNTGSRVPIIRSDPFHTPEP